MFEEYTVSIDDLQSATSFGRYRLRNLIGRSSPSIAAQTKERGAAHRLYRLTEILPRLREHQRWSEEKEAALLNYIFAKEFSDAREN